MTNKEFAFAERLVQLRRSRGMTQAQLANLIGVKQETAADMSAAKTGRGSPPL